MNKFAFQAFAFTILTICFAGCGGDSSQTTSGSKDASNPPALTLNDLGNANKQRNSELEDNSKVNNAQKNAAREDKSPRTRPSGRQTPGRDVDQLMGQEGSDSRQEKPTDDAMANSSKSPMRNGLFPNIDLGEMGQQASAGFGGGLFPNFDMDEMDETMQDDPDNLIGSSRDPRGGGRSRPDPRSGGRSALGQLAGDGDSETSDAEVEPESEAMEDKPSATLLANAKKLFQNHNEADAINTIYVNHLVSDDARSKYPLSWFTGLKEPRLFLRWGVGVVYSQPKDFDGRHPVLGDPGDEDEKPAGQSSGRSSGRANGGLGRSGLAGGGGRGRTGGSRTYKNIDTSRPDGTLMFYTGDFGQQLISHLETRLKDSDSPYYGQVLKDVMDIKIADDEPKNTRRNQRTPSRQFGIGGDRGGRSNLGGSNGDEDDDESSEQDAAVLDRAMGRSTATKPDDESTGSIIPGVLLLGVGKKAELTQRAREAGVDMLIMFSVKVSKSRGDYFSTSNMKIVNVNTEQNVFNSKPLKDNKVAEAIEEGDNPVKDEVEKAFVRVADKMYKAAEMPKGLTEDNVKKRIGRLLKQSGDNPLPAAVEIVSFYHAKLLSVELAKTALKRLFDSDESQVLVTGTSEERLEYLKDWLPEMSEAEDS